MMAIGVCLLVGRQVPAALSRKPADKLFVKKFACGNWVIRFYQKN